MKGHMPINEFQNMEIPHNDPFNKIFITLLKKHLYGYRLFDLHYKNLILKPHQYLIKYVQARMDHYFRKIPNFLHLSIL